MSQDAGGGGGRVLQQQSCRSWLTECNEGVIESIQVADGV